MIFKKTPVIMYLFWNNIMWKRLNDGFLKEENIYEEATDIAVKESVKRTV